jgi:hypothetical protein
MKLATRLEQGKYSLWKPTRMLPNMSVLRNLIASDKVLTACCWSKMDTKLQPIRMSLMESCTITKSI